MVVALTLAFGYLNFRVLYYVSDVRCGDEAHSFPVAGSPRADFCGTFVDNTNASAQWPLALLFYGPLFLIVLGGIWAVAMADGRRLRWVVLVAAALMLALLAPALALPSS